MSIERKILKWFATGKTGMSSEAMAMASIGIKGGRSHPYDPSGFKRCLMLLEAVPEIRNNFDKIEKLSPQWEQLIERWDEITLSYNKECTQDRAPDTYALIKEVIKL